MLRRGLSMGLFRIRLRIGSMGRSVVVTNSVDFHSGLEVGGGLVFPFQRIYTCS